MHRQGESMRADPKQIKAIFLAAVEKATPEARAAFLDEACGGDAELRRRTDELLRAHDGPGGLPGVADRTEPAGAAADDTLMGFLAASSEPGSLGRLDHYEVLEVVGKGGMGIVLRARDTKLARVVAIKVLAAPLAASDTARQRFVREARAAAAVRDDHVIAIYAVSDDGPVPYLVMEFIDGCNLEGLVRRGGPLGVKEVLRIAIQVASGLAAAHKYGLIHRDVKPANILLENGVQRVKLTDFGLACAADDASLTESGLIAGTPLYMAPEQAVGEPLDARADLFSLGSVLYELCTGRPAFRAPTTVAVIKRVRDEAPRPIREVNPDVPEPLCRLIERLHAKKPADRPASAQEVADRLAGLLADLQQPNRAGPISEGPASVGYVSNVPGPQARWKRAPRWFWAAAALVLLVAGLGLSEATGVTDVRGTVIRLFSPEGTLVVEVDDPGVSVTVDGGDVVITGAGAKEICLKPGQYKVEASKDGKVVRQELVTVTRNGRQVVRLSKESTPLSAADAWEKSVAALTAEEQVKAVAKRLRELNPGFDGKVTPTIRGPVVTGLGFNTHAVADLSPLRALKWLEALVCVGIVNNQGKLADLSPLRGLPLKTLDCGDNPVSDLSPLVGMPLEVLACYRTQVKDLTPLKGMPLTALNANRTRIADLSPLRDMKLTRLTHLSLEGTPVSDLSPLKGMKLKVLGVAYMRVTDLTPLRGMPLQELWLSGVTDLAPLRGLPLQRLYLLETPLTDPAPLQGMPLKEIVCDFQPGRDAKILRSLTGLEKINLKPAADFWKEVDATGPTTASVWEKSVAALPAEKQVEAVERRLRELNPEFRGNVESGIRDGKVWWLRFLSDRVTDISPLRALKGLESLDCGGSAPRKGRLSDLMPLRGLRLVHLNCTESQVSDLEPLRGMPLELLHCHGTGVDSLSPLEGMKLVSLLIQETRVSDLNPLRGMPLKRLDLAAVRGVADLVPLEGMPLEYLNVTGTALGNLDSVSSLKSLRWLLLDGTRVTTLEPLRPLRLEQISLLRTGVTDLTPIQGMPLKQLRLDYRPEREKFVRSFKKLEFINDKPVGVFWKEVDGK
jgi:Leucine-rich repeat (LRR) protein